MGVAVQRTALGPTLIVAIDRYDERTLVPDSWPIRVLPRRRRAPVVLSRSKSVRKAMIAATVVRLHLWKFGLAPADIAGLLAEYGWRETEQLGASEYRKRYLDPAGRSDPVSEIERAVWAQR